MNVNVILTIYFFDGFIELLLRHNERNNFNNNNNNNNMIMFGR